MSNNIINSEKELVSNDFVGKIILHLKCGKGRNIPKIARITEGSLRFGYSNCNENTKNSGKRMPEHVYFQKLIAYTSYKDLVDDENGEKTHWNIDIPLNINNMNLLILNEDKLKDGIIECDLAETYNLYKQINTLKFEKIFSSNSMHIDNMIESLVL